MAWEQSDDVVGEQETVTVAVAATAKAETGYSWWLLLTTHLRALVLIGRGTRYL